MIYPTRRAILLAAAIAPLALLIGVLVPHYWQSGLAAVALLLALLCIDMLTGPRSADADMICEGPASASVGSNFKIGVEPSFKRMVPARVELAIDASANALPIDGWRRELDMRPSDPRAVFDFSAARRGLARIGPVWVRWTGALGLLWKQKVMLLDQHVAIVPDIRPVRDKAAELIHRDAAHGVAPQRQIGEGSEFESLAEYRPGMDRRSIDWKQSARHRWLLAKEYRTERNNNIILAVDAGRAMCEPLAGVPRVDRAVSAALLTAFVALKEGDRIGFFSFDSHPRVASNTVSGHRSFPLLQRVAANIDYSANETNYTLAIATLAERLNRRSLIVMFTDFTDTISAEMMLHAVGALLRRHLLLFVVMRDEELERVIGAEPEEPSDVTRAATAAALLRQRKLVIARLRRLGVHVVEAVHDQAGPAVVNAYLDLKRRDLL